MMNLFKKISNKIVSTCFSIFFLWTLFVPKISTASHVSGGDMSFQCIGPNTYQITLNLFRDCSGITMSNSETITATSTCGGNITVTMNLSNVNGTNISQLCPTDSLNSTCFGGSLPGMELYTYTGTVVLAPPCDTWTLSWSTCCRNNTVNVPSSSSDDIYIQTTLNTVTAPCNNSPIFTSQPIPYVCANQTVNYNFGVSEPDGDSLSFQFISAMQAGAAPLTYGGGYSGAVPITGISIDPQTGQITFIPTMVGNFIVVVQCNEYDDAGNLISTTMRDIQFVVWGCTNIVPNLNAGQITNLVGNAVLTGPNSIDICEGNTFSFTAVYTDPDLGDSLFVNTNIGLVLPNSSYTVSGFNPLTVVYTWTVPPGSAGTNTTFIVQIEDNACPITGMQTFVYDINVLDRTLAYPQQTICGNQSAQLFASGGSVFTWQDLSGNIIPVSPQFSCNPCANPVVRPLTTTTYVVVSNLVGSCINSDTVTVTVVPDFTLSISQSQSSACLLQPIQLQANVNPPGAYSYFWTPQSVMSNPNIANPVANYTQSGSHTVYLAVQSPFGCVKQDSLQINISANVAPVVSIISDTVCTGGVNQLQVQFASTVPTNCGTINTPCGSPVQTGTVGTGTASNSATAYPAVFGNFYWGARHQMLYTVSELNSMGFVGGKITSIAFNISSLNASVIQYNNFEIRMKCTNATSLTNWESGLSVVYPAQNHNVAVGWNTFQLANIYEWDGVSNIIVETCFNNSSWDDNCSNTYTLTTFNSVLFYRADMVGVCYSGTPTTSTQRPNIRIGYCGGTANPADYTYTWTPANGVSDPTIQNPTTIPPGTSYQVVVTAIQGGCSDTATITINNLALPGTAQINLPSAFTYCLNDPQFQLTTTTPGGTWSGPGIDALTGFFNPLTAGLGNHQIVYTISGSAQCVSRDTIYLDVIGSPNAMINYSGSTDICISSLPISLIPVVPGGTWSGQGVDATSGIFSPQTAGTGTHTITYTLGSGNCVDVDQITLTVFPLLNDSISATSNLCATDLPINLYSATLGGTWTGTGVSNNPPIFDPQLSGVGLFILNYSVTGVCPFSVTTSVNVIPPPPTPIITNNSPICEGQLLQFTTTTVQNAQYSWIGPNGFVNNSQNPQVIQTTIQDSGRYTCIVNVNGCFSQPGYSDAIIKPTPPQPIIYSNDPICEGEDLVIFTDPLPNSTFVWSGPNGFSTNDREFTIGYATPASAGQYEIIAVSNGCISLQNFINIVVNPNPTVSFVADPSVTDILTPHVLFINSSSVGQHTWDFGDGTTTNIYGPNHTYQDTGTYTVNLTVTNPQTLCTAQSSQIVIIQPHFRMFIPSSFTPNGDGLNDVFKVRTEHYRTFNLNIYNRWGQIIFTSTDAEKGWDGKNGNIESPQGVYPYIVDVITFKGDSKKFVGTLTIIK